MSEENKFTEDLIEQIAGFFATKIGNPRLAYELVELTHVKGKSTSGNPVLCYVHSQDKVLQ